MRTLKVVAVFLALLVLGLPVVSETITGKVVSIADGDTITVLNAQNQQIKIRLHGIDCPESHQAFGTAAKKYTSDFVFGKTVTVHVNDTDRYGRKVGTVISPEGWNLNQSLVKWGFAWWYQQYAPNDKKLQQLEQEARANKRGLWTDPSPIPPWNFRRGKRPTPKPQYQKQNQAPVQQKKEITVYVTTSGKKYHRGSCQYLRKSKHAISLERAKSAGYTPCSKCNPPR